MPKKATKAAKVARSRRGRAAQAERPIVPFDPAIPTVQREIGRTTEYWSEYELDDGTVVRLKPILVDAQLAKGRYNAEGEPVYFLKTGVIINTRVPKKLRKKASRLQPKRVLK